MKLFRKKTIIFFIVIALVIAALFYFRYQVYYSRGTNQGGQIFIIEKGEGNMKIASKMEEEKIISGKFYFYYYLRTHNLANKIMPGDYNISGRMSIPEIASIITNTEKSYVKITFPEGLTVQEMADLIGQNGYDKGAFLDTVNNPETMRDKFPFLADKNITNLEGYLFPDTYFFAPDATPQGIVYKMLDNFGRKITPDMAEGMKKQNRSLSEEITMASLIQGEVKTFSEMKLVSGIFWKRLGIGMRLQSDTNLDTYDQKGLPPKAINNPGLEAITAAIYPQASDYLYFVSDKNTGETYFSRTFEEHKVNKIKAGY